MASLVSVSACSHDEPAPAAPDAGAPAYPAGPYGSTTNEVLADLTFADQGGAPVHLSDVRGQGELLVLRLTTSTCGPCQWSAAHTAELAVPGALFVDLLARGADGAPPSPADAARSNAITQVVTWLDPAVQLRAAEPALNLPAFVLVDARTMVVESVLTNPDPDALHERIVQTLTVIRGGEAAPPTAFPRYDDVLPRHEWDLVQAMALPPSFAPPPDPTDAHADDPRAAALGAKLFADATLSPSGTVSCQTCHDPKRDFTDGRVTAQGVAAGDRNTPSLALAAHQRWQFWDGRVDTLWAQALGPLENEREFGSSRLFVVQRAASAYRAELEAIYGPLPALAGLPAAGKPGDPAWDALPETDRTAVTRAFVSVGKAIAAFERTLRPTEIALDRYARGDKSALPAEQKNALHRFFVGGCAQCHFGPRFTDDAFHAVRFPTGRVDGAADPGRSEGLKLYAAAEFGAATPWSDLPSTRPEALAFVGDPLLVGQFKTPSLRGVALTAPYGHGGSEPDLRAVTTLYGDGGLGPGPTAAGETEPWVPKFDTHAQAELAGFLELFR